MNKVKRKEMDESLNDHELRISRIEWALEKAGIVIGADEPKLKQLDQSVFDHEYVTDHFKYAALNSNGQSIFFSDKPKYDLGLGIWYSTAGSTMPMLKGYDASNWQNSLIERDKVELTGSDLCRAMLERGDKCVLIRMGVRDDRQAKDIGRFAIATSIDESGRFNVMSDQQPISKVDFAIPINNHGEPLTATDVGL